MFSQEDFWKLHFKNLFLTPWPTYATNQNHLNNFGRGLPRDQFCLNISFYISMLNCDPRGVVNFDPRGIFWTSLVEDLLMMLQYSQRGTFINPLTPVVRIIHARSNTATEHPLTLVVMTLAFGHRETRWSPARDHRGQRFFIVYIMYM